MEHFASLLTGRSRVIAVVVPLVASMALAWAPAAVGAGDPIARGKFSFKRSSGFRKQLQRNGLKLKPKSIRIQTGSTLDPTTGAGTLRIGKLTFKKGAKKLVFSNVKVRLGANGRRGTIKGSKGKIFSLKGGRLSRDGFGARVSGIKLKFLPGAAKKLNRPST